MSAFLVADITVISDPAGYDRYKLQVPPTFSSHGGRYLARGGAVTVLEGNWHPSRLVVVRFDSVDQAVGWWHSPEYASARALRQRSASTNMLVLEGVER
jgi:uncharacterized protein (DUF1330 family)